MINLRQVGLNPNAFAVLRIDTVDFFDYVGGEFSYQHGLIYLYRWMVSGQVLTL
jgi:hypothetical protein